MALTHPRPLWAAAIALALILGCGSDETPTPDGTEAPTDAPTTTAVEETSEPSETDATTPMTDGAVGERSDGAPETESDADTPRPPDTSSPTPDVPAPIADSGGDAMNDVPLPAPDGDLPVTDTASTPVDPLAGLPLCTGPVVETAIASPLPKSAGSAAFTPWDGVGWDGVLDTVVSLYQGAAETVLSDLDAVGYTACRGVDEEANLVLFAPATADTGHARAVWRVGPARPVVLEAPHPVYDMQTAVEAAFLFETIQARGLIASGTHRCVSDVASECDGKTKVCSAASAPYPITDMAHVTTSFFQVLHAAFELGLQHVAAHTTDAGAADYLLVSVHGMSGDGISLSNGTTQETHAAMVPAKLTLALMAALPDAYITSCNDFEGAVVDKRLCGSTNTQGRWTNGSGEPCQTGATVASGHFAHMEQTLEIRQNPEPVAEALMAVFDVSD